MSLSTSLSPKNPNLKKIASLKNYGISELLNMHTIFAHVVTNLHKMNLHDCIHTESSNQDIAIYNSQTDYTEKITKSAFSSIHQNYTTVCT